MATRHYHDFVSRVRREKAEYLTAWLMEELADYYEGSGVEIRDETGLADRLSKCLALHLPEINV